MANIYDMSDTWNDGATTFTAIKMNVTDSASASASLLMDLQVGGASVFSVQKSNNPLVGTIELAGDKAISHVGNNAFLGNGAGSDALVLNTSGQAAILPGGAFCWASTTVLGASKDLFLYRDAANTLAQRNSTNAQTFNLYNTYTDASNYERGFMRWNSNVLEIGTEKGTTGSFRAFKIAGATGGHAILEFPISGSNTSGTRIYTFGNGRLNVTNSSNANGQIMLGLSSSHSGIKGNGTTLEVRLADDSAFTNVKGKLTTETAYTAGAPTATGYIVLYDSTGTAYKVPAEAL